jgi:hypothetical protein
VSGLAESIHQRGRTAVLAGRARLDSAPRPGSTRWGLSLDVRLDPVAEQRLHELTTEASAHAGPGQWLTGGLGSSHLTVTYLERRWRQVGADDGEVRRYADLAGQVARSARPLRWQVTGLVLADRGVLAVAEPVDDAPGQLRAQVLRRLGTLGDQEAHYRRATWWSTLLHFAAPVPDPEALTDWVDARTRLPAVPLTGDRLEVVRYAHDGSRVVPVPLATVQLPVVPEGGVGAAHA